MAITFTTARRAPATARIVAHGLTTEALAEGSLPAGVDAADLERLGFEAKAEQVQVLPGDGRLVAVVGLGDAGDVAADTVRRSAAALARAASRQRSVACDLAAVSGLDAAEATQAVVEGIGLAAYRFGYASTKPKPDIERVSLVGSTAAGVRAAVDRGTAVVEGVSLARDLVNEPGGKLTAPEFANRVRRMARDKGITVKVLDEAAIKRARLGGLLGVAGTAEDSERPSIDHGSIGDKESAYIGPLHSATSRSVETYPDSTPGLHPRATRHPGPAQAASAAGNGSGCTAMKGQHHKISSLRSVNSVPPPQPDKRSPAAPHPL